VKKLRKKRRGEGGAQPRLTSQKAGYVNLKFQFAKAAAVSGGPGKGKRREAKRKEEKRVFDVQASEKRKLQQMALLRA